MNNTQATDRPRRFTWIARMQSFVYAWNGILHMLKTQHNAWLHGLASIAICGFAYYCKVTPNDWRFLLMAMAFVWITEAINTAIEYVCDIVSPEYSDAVKHAKDIAAGSVLIAAVLAASVGVLTFWPYI
jgi:diacylglycerol kinase (ATP)